MNNVSDTGMPGHCRSELWSCLSSVLERGIRYVKKTGDVIRYLLLHAKYILKSTESIKQYLYFYIFTFVL